MDGHDAHAAGGVLHLRRGGLAACKLLAQCADEGEKPLVSRALIIFAQLQKGQQVFLPRRAAVHCAEHGEHVAAAEDLVQQLPHAHRRRPFAQRAQRRKKAPALLRVVQQQRVVKVARLLLCAHCRELVGRKAEERRAQHRQQRHVLTRIVDDLQKSKQHRDLRRGKKILTRVGRTADAARLQRAAIVQKARAR